MAIGLDFLVGELLAPSLAARGLGPLLVRVDGRSWVAGEEREPVGELEAPAFDLFRALTGRRSRAQVSGFGWSVDPEPYLDAFTSGPFTVAPADLVE